MSLVRRAPPQSGRALESDELGQVDDEARKLRRAREELDRAIGAGVSDDEAKD